MADADSRTTEQVRVEIEREREQLATAVEQLREAADPSSMVRSKLPVVAVGALGAGFVLAGGVGATMRLLFRRAREGDTRAQVGRFRLVDRS
jgi:Protein of unknown function (DUF3618)